LVNTKIIRIFNKQTTIKQLVMMIKNTKIEKKQQFYEEVLFPQLKNNGEGIGNYITQLESRIDTLTTFVKIQSEQIQTLNQLINNTK
jgi:hypothetical protein